MFPAPIELPILPENMPYYRGPRVIPPLAPTNEPSTNVNYCQSLFTQIVTNNCQDLLHLSVTPVKFGEFDTVTPSTRHAALNHEFPCYAQQILHYSWAVYSFGSGHFPSTISLQSLPFCIKLACDQYNFGCALFWEFMQCMQIFENGKDLLNHICSSGDSSQIHGYSFSLLLGQ